MQAPDAAGNAGSPDTPPDKFDPANAMAFDKAGQVSKMDVTGRLLNGISFKALSRMAPIG
jgi:hypothetical protein